MQEMCPIIAAFLGCMGVAFSIIFAICGAALGTAKSGVAIMQSGLNSPDLVWRNLIPVVMAGVNRTYGLITSIILLSNIVAPDGNCYKTYSLYTGAAHLAAGLICGLSGLSSGMCIGIAGDAAIWVWTRRKQEAVKKSLLPWIKFLLEIISLFMDLSRVSY